jgi:hypothetical protein
MTATIQYPETLAGSPLLLTTPSLWRCLHVLLKPVLDRIPEHISTFAPPALKPQGRKQVHSQLEQQVNNHNNYYIALPCAAFIECVYVHAMNTPFSTIRLSPLCVNIRNSPENTLLAQEFHTIILSSKIIATPPFLGQGIDF